MKKVVHVTSVHAPFDPRIFQKECVSLHQAGYEVALVAPHDRNEKSQGVSIIPIEREHSRFGRMMKTAKAAVARAAMEHADLYHLHDPELLPWMGKLRKQGVPVIFDMHEDLPFQIRFKVWVPKILRPGLAGLVGFGEKFLLKNTPTVYAEKSYPRSRPWITDFVEVLNYPRFDLLNRLGKVEGGGSPFRIGYMGAVTRNRGSLRTLEALKMVQDYTDREIVFECIGNIRPGHLDELRSFVHEHDISGAEFVGYLPAPEGWARMANFDLGMAVLAPIPNYVESYPTKLFEYMSLGVPAIVSDFPLYRQIVQKYSCGMLVDPLDSRSIAKAIIELMEDPDLAARMGANGKEAAREFFSWESQQEKLIAFYAQLLNE